VRRIVQRVDGCGAGGPFAAGARIIFLRPTSWQIRRCIVKAFSIKIRTGWDITGGHTFAADGEGKILGCVSGGRQICQGGVVTGQICRGLQVVSCPGIGRQRVCPGEGVGIDGGFKPRACGVDGGIQRIAVPTPIGHHTADGDGGAGSQGKILPMEFVLTDGQVGGGWLVLGLEPGGQRHGLRAAGGRLEEPVQTSVSGVAGLAGTDAARLGREDRNAIQRCTTGGHQSGNGAAGHQGTLGRVHLHIIEMQVFAIALNGLERQAHITKPVTGVSAEIYAVSLPASDCSIT